MLMSESLFPSLFLASPAVATCYEGDGDTSPDTGDSGPDDAADDDGDSGTDDDDDDDDDDDLRAVEFTPAQQKKLNKLLADDRHREKRKYRTQLTSKDKEVRLATERLNSLIVESSLSRAIGEAEAIDGEFVGDYLRTKTSLVILVDEAGKPTGEARPMVQIEGKTVTPKVAVEMLRNSSPHLFRGGAVSGIGGAATAGGAGGKPGVIDYKNMDATTYAKIRAQNPELLGLRRKR